MPSWPTGGNNDLLDDVESVKKKKKHDNDTQRFCRDCFKQVFYVKSRKMHLLLHIEWF